MKNAELAVPPVRVSNRHISYQDLPVLVFCLFALVVTVLSLEFDLAPILLFIPTAWFFGAEVLNRAIPHFESTLDQSKRRFNQAKFVVPLISTAGIYAAAFIDQISIPHLVALSISGGLLVTLAYQNGRCQMFRRGFLSGVIRRLMHALVLLPHRGVDQMYGHRLTASTPSDPSSSRMGENYYRYLARSLKGALPRAFRDEQNRCSNQSTITALIRNEVAQTLILSVLMMVACFMAGGAILLSVFFVQAVISLWQLSSADYAQHYGLLRKRFQNGSYEPFKSHHAWSTSNALNNRLLGSLDTSHQPEQTDNEIQASESYTRYEYGYNALSLYALVPRRWFAIANEALARAVEFDLKRVNLDGEAYDTLMERLNRV